MSVLLTVLRRGNGCKQQDNRGDCNCREKMTRCSLHFVFVSELATVYKCTCTQQHVNVLVEAVAKTNVGFFKNHSHHKSFPHPPDLSRGLFQSCLSDLTDIVLIGF